MTRVQRSITPPSPTMERRSVREVNRNLEWPEAERRRGCRSRGTRRRRSPGGTEPEDTEGDDEPTAPVGATSSGGRRRSQAAALPLQNKTKAVPQQGRRPERKYNKEFERSAGRAEGIRSPGRRRRTGEQTTEERRAKRRKASLRRRAEPTTASTTA